jgi:hypothetical protein
MNLIGRNSKDQLGIQGITIGKGLDGGCTADNPGVKRTLALPSLQYSQ